MSVNVTEELNALRKDASEADNGSAVGAKKKEAIQADLAALEKNAKEITDTGTAYEKAYPQLVARYALLKEFAEAQKAQLKAKLPDKLEKWLEEKAAKLAHDIASDEGVVEKATWYLQDQRTDYEGKKTAAAQAQTRFEYWKSSPKPYEEMLKNWQDRRTAIEKLRETEDQFPLAYLYTLLLLSRLKAPFTPDVLRIVLRRAWARLFAARKVSCTSRIEFDTATTNLETYKKALELLLSQGVEDIMRELPRVKPAPDPATTT